MYHFFNKEVTETHERTKSLRPITTGFDKGLQNCKDDLEIGLKMKEFLRNEAIFWVGNL